MMQTQATRQIPLLDLKAQHAPLREELLAEMIRVMDSQRFIMGPDIAELEREIAAYCRVEHAIACASGSDALFLALLGLDIKPGDKVLTTPYTFFATGGAISRIGATPVFVDVDAATFNMDMALAAEAFEREPGIRAVMPIHLFGGCAEMAPLMELASRYGVAVIEDAAQALGAEYQGRRAGSIGAIGCFSFFPSKNLGCFGDGGLLTTRDPALARKLAALRVHGSHKKYYHEWVGVNSRMDTLQAAVLRVKLPHLDGWTEGRQRNAGLYRQRLGAMQLPLILPEAAPYQTRHIWNQFVIRGPRRDELLAHLKNAGVATEIYYPLPLHLQECFAELGHRAGDFPVSERLALESLALPVHSDLPLEDLEYICEQINGFYAG